MAIGTLGRQRAALRCGDVAYLRHGSGPPLLLVHGIPTSARLWEPLLGDLGERFDCIAVDLLDMGESRSRPGTDVSSPGQAAMLADLLDHLGIGETLLAAHDQGGAHALRFLDAHGDRVRAVVLADIVCYDNWLVPAIQVMELACRWPAGLHALSRTGLVDIAFMKAWPMPQTVIRGPVPAAWAAEWMAAMHAGGADLEAFARYVRSQSTDHTADTEAITRAWSKPALVVWAAHDYFLPVSWGVRLAQDLAGAADQPLLLPFAGHFFHADVPRTAARVIGDFLADV